MAKRIPHLDVLGELRRARRIINRIERYLTQQERRERRTPAAIQDPSAALANATQARADELGEQG